MAAIAVENIIQSVVGDHVAFATSDQTHVVTLPRNVDPDKTLVLLDNAAGGGASPNNFLTSHELDVDELTLRRAQVATPTQVNTVGYKLIEFISGARVLRFHGTTAQLNSNQAIGETINLSRCFAILHSRANNGGSGWDNNEFMSPELIDAGGGDCDFFQVKTHTTPAAANMFWTLQIVVFDDDAGVLSEQVVGIVNGTSQTFVLSRTYDTKRTCVFGQMTGGATDDNCSTSELIDDGASLRIQKRGTSSVFSFRGFVVQWPDPIRIARLSLNAVTNAAEYDIQNVLDWDRAAVYKGGGHPNFGTYGGAAGSPGAAQMIPSAGSTSGKVQMTRTTGQPVYFPMILQAIAFDGAEEPTPPWVGPLRENLAAMPENHWRCPALINTPNNWAAVRCPSDRTPNNSVGGPNTIALAWASFVIDTKRGDVVIYGGGHANYSGNELYKHNLLHSDTWEWRRVCLPAQVKPYGTSAYQGPILGENDGPASAHTYGNSGYLQVSDYYITFGGAAQNTGGRYRAEVDGDLAGPYIARLDVENPNAVSGATGGGVVETDIGIEVWHNLYDEILEDDVGSDITTMGYEGTVFPFVDGSGNQGFYMLFSTRLVKVLINGDIKDANNWTATRIGTTSVIRPFCQGAFDLDRNICLFFDKNISGTLTNCLVIYDLEGPANSKTSPYLITPADPDNVLGTLGRALNWLSLVYDPVRDRYVGSHGIQNRIVEITGPGVIPDGTNTTAVTTGWTIRYLNPTRDTDYRTMSDRSSTLGIGTFGKFKYYRQYDSFYYLEVDVNNNDWRMWVYKPHDWSPQGLYEDDLDLSMLASLGVIGSSQSVESVTFSVEPGLGAAARGTFGDHVSLDGEFEIVSDARLGASESISLNVEPGVSFDSSVSILDAIAFNTGVGIAITTGSYVQEHITLNQTVAMAFASRQDALASLSLGLEASAGPGAQASVGHAIALGMALELHITDSEDVRINEAFSLSARPQIVFSETVAASDSVTFNSTLSFSTQERGDFNVSLTLDVESGMLARTQENYSESINIGAQVGLAIADALGSVVPPPSRTIIAGSEGRRVTIVINFFGSTNQ